MNRRSDVDVVGSERRESDVADISTDIDCSLNAFPAIAVGADDLFSAGSSRVVCCDGGLLPVWELALTTGAFCGVDAVDLLVGWVVRFNITLISAAALAGGAVLES